MFENYIERKAKGLVEVSTYDKLDKDLEKIGTTPAIINKRFTVDGEEYFEKSPIDIKKLDDEKTKLQSLLADIDQLKMDVKT